MPRLRLQIPPSSRRDLVAPRSRRQIAPRSRGDRAEIAPIKNAHLWGKSVARSLEMASPRTVKDLIHGAREETLASVVRAARREMARGGQAGGRVAGGNKKSAGAPTRDAERGVKARGALSSWTAPRTEDASCPRRPRRPTPRRVRTCGASARSLADSGTRRRVGGGGQAGDVEVLGTFTGSAMGEVEVD